MKTIDVLLADDHAVVREGLRKLLEAEHDIAVVGEAESGRQAVALARKLRPAVVVLDIAMPLLNGLEATRQIRESVPDVKVIILSAHSDESYVERVMALGAVGYLVKQSSSHFLCEAIRAVHKGGAYFSPAIAKRRKQRHAESLDRQGRAKTADVHLSSREVEVLQLVAEGKANKQVAAELGISVKTVEKHRDHLMRKLDIHDTASLTRHAIAAGIIEVDVRLSVE